MSTRAAGWDDILPGMPDYPRNTLTWLMDQHHFLCILNGAQGSCQKTVSPSTQVPNWWGISRLIILTLFPLSGGYTYVLVCVDAVSDLTQAFPCCANPAATIRGSGKLSTMHGYLHQIDGDQGHISRAMIYRTGRSSLPIEILPQRCFYLVSQMDWRMGGIRRRVAK